MEWIPEIAAEAIQSSLRSMRRVTHRDSNRCIELKALAKVNLGLDVIGKRENGYHDVRMVMQSIYLYDDVKIERSKTREIQIRTNLYFLPTDSSNIAYKAAAMLIEEFHIEEGVIVTLNKHIPVSAGLAGGSSDAAAVLYGMNRLFRLGLSQEELMKRGVKLGADVPYCIMRGTVLAEGIGEELTPLVPMPKCTVVVAKPSISVSTKMVYEALDSKESIMHPDIDALRLAVEAGDLKGIASHMGNALEEVTIPMYPVIESIKTQMKEAGALNAMMSGSGPTVFGLFTSRQQARRAQDHIKKSGLARQVYVTNIHGARRCDHGG
jgi:4-diphosphocytidyl-2-C-methyl-D-erythritol kinase